MASKNFESALAAVLKHEGLFSNHPDDPGGATMKGVIQRVYNAYRQKRGLKMQSVKHISDDEIRTIYKLQYWDAIKGDQLPSGVDYAVFDGAVNSGPRQSIKWLQRALGVDDDGQLGPITLKAALLFPDQKKLVDYMLDRRMAFLRSLRHWRSFGKGWTNRVAGVRKSAKAIA
jgi:lysozyme family protein